MTGLHPSTEYWDKGTANVPTMTGAAGLLDGRDLVTIAAALGLSLPLRGVLDIGCGTGRAAKLCDGYLGTDIAPSAVRYCENRGIPADVMTGPGDIPEGRFGTILCISVFTHMGREERRSYLREFRRRSDRVVADVILGDGTGDIALWTSLEDEYRADIEEAGYEVRGVTTHRWLDQTHTYFLMEAA